LAFVVIMPSESSDQFDNTYGRRNDTPITLNTEYSP
jgi:hypothetical protein